MVIRGQDRERVDLSHLLSAEFETYVLYPSPDAMDVEDLKPVKPVHFIIADGNWRQAGKVNQRHPELAHLPRVKIGGRNLAKHHLRKEHMAEGLSTLEAIALALGSVEGAAVRESLMALYQAKLKATLDGRPGKS